MINHSILIHLYNTKYKKENMKQKLKKGKKNLISKFFIIFSI